MGAVHLVPFRVLSGEDIRSVPGRIGGLVVSEADVSWGDGFGHHSYDVGNVEHPDYPMVPIDHR